MSEAPNYTEFFDEDLNREVLTQDADFMNDAMSFLEKRTGKADFENEDEVFDEFMEHMRFHNTNEITAVRDLMYAQEADDEDKAEFGRLLSTFDRMEGEDFFDAAGDYIQAGLTSPSTWLGLVTGGAGKMTGVAAQQAAKTGVRAVLGNVMQKAITAPSVVKGMAVEGAIGLGAGAAQESARVETGVQEEFTGGRTLMTGAAQAIGGALPAGIAGLQQGAMAKRAMKIRESGEQAMTEAAEEGAKNVKKVLSSVKNKATITKTQDEILTTEVKKAREFLDTATGTVKEGLPKEKVKEGLALLQALSPTEKMIASLNQETIDAITAASIKLGKELNVKPGERITSAVSRALDDETLTLKQVDEIMQEFNLTSSQFSYMYMAELSRSGRNLASQSKIARQRGQTAAQKEQAKRRVEAEKVKLDRLATAVEGYLNQTGGNLTKAEAIDIAKSAGKRVGTRNWFQEADRFRLSMMTGQLATTVRNVAGGSFRIATDVFDKSFKALFSLGKDYDDPLAVAKYAFFNQAEAKVVREMFEKTMPIESQKFFSTFFESTTASAKLADESFLTRTGAVVNTLNRLSDNMYKQAIFAGRLDQLTRKQMNKPLSDVIAEGKFAQIDKGMIKDAIEESLEFVYQKTPTGDNVAARAGRGLLTMHRELPFFVSTFIPFPRFVINQLDFVAQHMPVFGMLTNKLQKGKLFDAESLAKQTTGMGMLSVAYDMRARNGVETEWYEYTTEDGKTIDMRPIAGPFNAFLLAADAIYRAKQGTDHKQITGIVKDGWQALGGPSFRAGTGLSTVDRLFEDVDSQGFEEGFGRWVGDTINTFTLPLATFRDLGSLTDEEKRLVPETAYVDLWDIIAARATRSLPEIPGLPSLSGMISETLGTGAVQPRSERPNILTGEPLRSVDPLERQIFGTGKSAQKNALQRKLSELQMSPYQIYKPSDFPFEDRLMREQAGRLLASELNKRVQSEEFNKKTAKQQKNELKTMASVILRDINKGVKQRLNSPEYAQFKFERLGKELRDDIREQYARQYPEDKEMDYNKALGLVEGVRQRAGKRNFSKGGAFLDIFGGAGKKADDIDDLDTVTDADYLDELTDDELLGYGDELDEFYDTADDSPMFSKEDMDKLETAGELALETIIGFTPIVGDVYDAYNVADNLRQAKYVDAAIDAIGFIPFIGNALSKGVKVTLDMFKNSDPVIKKRALADFARKEGRLPDFSDEADLDSVVQSAAKQEKIVAGAAVSDTPLFHGDTSIRGDSLQPEKINAPHKHAELKVNAMSTSRDPVMSVDQFASRSGRQDPIDAMYTVRPKRGIMAKQDLRPDQYDRLSSPEDTINIPTGAVESGLPTQLPKSRHVEAETMITDLDTVDIKKLADQPELADKVRKGVKTLEETRDLVAEAMDIGTEMISKKEAMEFYSKLAKAMKKAQGLGAFTSKAGARGSYDQHLTAMAVEASDPRRGFDYYGLTGQIQKAYLLLKGTQKGKLLEELYEGLSETNNAMFGFPTAGNVAKEYTEAKKKIFDVTQRMNRGGLASKRK